MNRFLIVGLVAAAPAALFAHHGPILYDMKKEVAVEGTLSDVKFGVPHATAKLSWQKKNWKLVFGGAPGLVAGGITEEMLVSAKSVKVIGNLRRDGKPEIRVTKMTVDGKKVL